MKYLLALLPVRLVAFGFLPEASSPASVIVKLARSVIADPPTDKDKDLTLRLLDFALPLDSDGALLPKKNPVWTNGIMFRLRLRLVFSSDDCFWLVFELTAEEET